MVEVCFGYVSQKFNKQLDYAYTVPKMKYKGATIQYQRIKVKKTKNLIEEVQMSEEERKAMEQRAFEEERRKEAMREKEPVWALFCVLDERLNKEFGKQAYLEQVIKQEYENAAVGDDKDRWSHLQENFSLKEQFDVLEEYEGTNHEEAHGLVLQVTLPLLSRGHAVQTHIMRSEFVQVQVPSLYHIVLSLPFKVENVTAHFDCKVRRLFVHFNRKVIAPRPDDEEDVIEIDTATAEEITVV